jgi:hypothetical protein
LSLLASLCVPSAGASSQAADFQKVLFLGNSITLHGPAPKIGWLGNWGMAASTEQKDFVHLVVAGLANRSGKAPVLMVKNIAEFERNYATYDPALKMKEAFAFGADLVVVAIGENVPALTSEEAKVQFKAGLLRVLHGLQPGSHPTIVVRSCFWANKAKDDVLRQACREVDGIFVDAGPLGKDPSNYARSERSFQHAGVAAHPGDKGMRAIAEAILGALDSRQSGASKGQP